MLTARFVPGVARPERPRRIDPVGQLLVIVAARLADLRDHRGDPGAGWSLGRRVSALFLLAAAAARLGLIAYEPRRTIR